MATTTPTLATIGARVLARLVDAGILAALGFTVLEWSSPGDVTDAPGWAPWVAFGIGFVYEVVLTARHGQTLGKRLAGIRVVDARTGAPATFLQSVRRAGPMLVGRVPYVGWLYPVSYLPAVWDPRRRGWHDRLAGTVVVLDEGDD